MSENVEPSIAQSAGNEQPFIRVVIRRDENGNLPPKPKATRKRRPRIAAAE